MSRAPLKSWFGVLGLNWAQCERHRSLRGVSKKGGSTIVSPACRGEASPPSGK